LGDISFIPQFFIFFQSRFRVAFDRSRIDLSLSRELYANFVSSIARDQGNPLPPSVITLRFLMEGGGQERNESEVMR